MAVDRLEDYFNSIELPDSIQLNECTFVSDVRKLIYSNINYLRSNSGKAVFMPYYNQLLELKQFLKTKKDEVK